MKTARTEDVIAALVADATPVQRLSRVGIRAARWLGASAVVTAAGAWMIGLREDLPAAVRDTGFAGDAALTGATAGLAAAAAFALSVPAAERSRSQRVWPLAAAAVWIAEVAWRIAREGGTWQTLVVEPWHLACGLRMLVLAAVPAAAVFVMIRRAAPLEPHWTAALASLSALACGAVGMQMTCPIDSASHVLVAHVSALALLTTVGLLAGARAFRRY